MKNKKINKKTKANFGTAVAAMVTALSAKLSDNFKDVIIHDTSTV